MPKAEDVATYLLSLSNPGTAWSITPLKLQKLLYYCQGWYMAFSKGQRLFDDNIIAWDHGPVVRDIYYKYKEYKYFTIPESPFNNIDENGNKIFSDDDINILNAVWEAYGHYDGKYLEELTHQEEPWQNTNRNDIIDEELLLNFFIHLAQTE